jgi:hypothetical protein
MVVAVFVAPYLLEATARFVLAAVELPDVQLGVITCEPVEALHPDLRARLQGHWRVDDALDPNQLVEAVVGIGHQLGPPERLVGALEQLQVPLARVREALGIDGMDVATALNVRDKSRMKQTLQEAGVPCARHALVRGPKEAYAFAEQVGFPLVAKPPAGAGAQSTFRLDGGDLLAGWLSAVPLGPHDPALLEEFLTGEEHTFDSVTIGGNTIWTSIADYHPPPLEVLRNPWIQWTVLLPRDIGGPEYAGIHHWGPAALAALGVRDALTHMEWFRRPDGSVAISEVAARPPGAQLTSMHGYAHDFDLFRAWAELVILGSFPTPQRTNAAGTAFLRGMGHGRVRAVHGVDEVQRDIGHLIVEARLPRPGQPAAGDYVGEGYVIVRGRETAPVVDALQRIVSGIRVELAES